LKLARSGARAYDPRVAKAIKVQLTNRGEDQETPWAHDLGPADGPKGSRKVRLVNVPFMHAKPTWGDVIVVHPVEDGLPTWDRDGVGWAQLGTRILEDGGRWAMIVDYKPTHGTTGDVAFDALAHACAELDIVCEGAWGPEDASSGRSYLAVKTGTSDTAVMNHLGRARLPCTLTQIHPAPPKSDAKPRAATAPIAKPAATKPTARAKTPEPKPARAKTAPEPRAKKPTSPPPAAKPASKRPGAKRATKRPKR
jgi:hypothetical protein